MRRSRTSLLIITIFCSGFFLSLSAIPCYGQWLTTYGGTGNDHADSIQQTQDQGYIVAGLTDSFGAGSYDAWIMKLDSTGAIT